MGTAYLTFNVDVNHLDIDGLREMRLGPEIGGGGGGGGGGTSFEEGEGGEVLKVWRLMQQYYVDEDDSFLGVIRVRLMSDFDRGVGALLDTVDERQRTLKDREGEGDSDDRGPPGSPQKRGSRSRLRKGSSPRSRSRSRVGVGGRKGLEMAAAVKMIAKAKRAAKRMRAKRLDALRGESERSRSR